MQRRFFTVVFIFFLIGTVHAADYFWDLINALSQNDLQTVDKILKDNAGAMTATDRRLIMNFAITYSYGENTLGVFELLQKYNIRPGGFDLFTAINRNQPDAVIQMLLHNGAEANGEILLLAMEKQRFALAEQFIKSGVDVNYQYPLIRNYADGMTPLLYASKWNNPELVKLLLENGANINARSKDGNTALSIAQTNGNGPIYYYLLEHGAAEPGAVPPPPPNSGISGIFDNQSKEFQKGLYRLAGGDMYIRFLGNADSGNINYIRNGMSYTGLFRIGNNNMTLIMEGRTFVYRIDSNTSFSGNGEVWVRTGN